jgi:hypothetical protein
MSKYTFEYSDVIEANSEDEALDKFEEALATTINEAEAYDNIVDWFTIRRLD